MSAPTSTSRLLGAHLRAGFRASLLVALLVAITVFVVALVPRAFAEVATAELRFQLGQEDPVRLDLAGEGRIGLPPPPRTGELTVETMFGRTDEVITALPSTLPRPLRDGAGEPEWLVRSVSGAGSIEGVTNLVLSLRIAIDLDWTERIWFTSGAEPRPWEFDETVAAAENPIEIALSERSAAEMGVSVGDLLSYTTGPLVVAGIYEPVDPDDPYWSHVYDLARPSVIRETGMPPRIQASAYVAPGLALSLREPFVTGILQAWIPVDPEAYSFSDAEALGSQTRNLTATPIGLPDFGQLNLATSFPQVLDEAIAAVAATTALIALSASGLLGVLVATYALSIQALVRRRRASLSLAAARGASLRQLRVVMVLEACAVALPGSALAIAAAALLIPQRIGLDGWLAPAVLALTPVVLAAVLVAPGSLREERQDLGVRSRSRLRWVLEASVAGMAVVALVLLQRRGLIASSDVVGTDPLLAATPVLLAATVGLLALRVYPIPLRLLRRLARGGSAPVAEVGSARAIREPAIGAIAALALVVGVSIVVFSTVMITTVGASLERAAEDVVGADVQVTAHDIPDSLVDELRAIPEVAGAVALTYRANVTLTDEAGGTKIGVVLVDPAALALVRPDLPELPPAAGGSLPVLVSESLSARIRGTDLRLVDVPVASAGVIPETAIPGMIDRWLITDEAAAPELGLSGQVPSRILIDLTEGADSSTVDAITEAVLAAQPDQFAGSARVYDVDSELGQRRSAPLTAGLEGALAVVAAATLILTMLVVALAAAASAGTRNRVVGVLRILGMTPRQIRALVAWEFGPVAVAALLVGTALGLGLPFLVTAVLDLRAFFGGVVMPRPTLDATWIAAAVGVYALAVLSAVLVATAVGRRFAPASTLKMGES